MKSESQFIEYEELLNLASNQCVGVNRVYFFFLFAKYQRLNPNEEIKMIFTKYLEIESMEEKLLLNSKIKGYYLVEANDIKKLINYVKQIPWNDVLIKINIKTQELKQIHNDVRKQYLDKFKSDEISKKLKR